VLFLWNMRRQLYSLPRTTTRSSHLRPPRLRLGLHRSRRWWTVPRMIRRITRMWPLYPACRTATHHQPHPPPKAPLSSRPRAITIMIHPWTGSPRWLNLSCHPWHAIKPYSFPTSIFGGTFFVYTYTLTKSGFS
jgi:hypothetical protein